MNKPTQHKKINKIMILYRTKIMNYLRICYLLLQFLKEILRFTNLNKPLYPHYQVVYHNTCVLRAIPCLCVVDVAIPRICIIIQIFVIVILSECLLSNIGRITMLEFNNKFSYKIFRELDQKKFQICYQTMSMWEHIGIKKD